MEQYFLNPLKQDWSIAIAFVKIIGNSTAYNTFSCYLPWL